MASLIVLEGANAGREYEIPDVCFLGRSAQCDVRVGDLTVSRKHCRILRLGSRFWVEDLGSGNGTYVNRQMVVREELRHNDEIRIGHSRFRFADRQRELPAIVPSQTSLQLKRLQPIVENHSIDQEIDASHEQVAPPAERLPQQELERAYRRLKTVVAISRAVSSILSIDKLLNEILVQLMHVFPQASLGAVLVLDDHSKELVPFAVWQRRLDNSLEEVPTAGVVDSPLFPLSSAVIEAVVSKRKAVLLNERLPSELLQGSDSSLRQITMTGVFQGSMMCAPLESGGEVLGILRLSTRSTQVFNRDDLDLHAGIAVQAGTALSNAKLHDRLLKQDRIHEDLRVAEQIQRSFLPRVQPSLPGYSFHAHYDPAYEVGGDFYDFIQLPDGRLAILIGDVSGKGVPAALLMARMASELRVCALSEREPAQVMTRVNRALIEMGHTDMFVTAIYMVLDPLRRRLVWSNAGHLPPFVRHAQDGNRVEPLEEVVSLALGILPDTRYDEDSLVLDQGDVVLLFTDGVVEAKNRQGEEFGFVRLAQAVAQGQSSGEMLSKVLTAVSTHVGGEAQYDDVTIVTLGHPGANEPAFGDLTQRVSHNG